MNRSLLISLCCVLSAAAMAQEPVVPVFTEVKGDHEFTGTMLVRPKQESQLIQEGKTYSAARFLRVMAANRLQGVSLGHYPEVDQYLIKVPRGWNENTLARELMKDGTYEYVEPNWRVFPLAIPNDAQYATQWHHPIVSAPSAWDMFRGNGSVIVAITDTGVRITHQDLAANIVSGANSSAATTTTGPVVPQTSGGNVNDDHGHGTHCAGIAAAIGNNGVGVSGYGWNTKIMPVRVTPSGAGGSSTINALCSGIRWAADNGARVISTSFSGYSNAAVQTTGAYVKTTRNGLSLWAAGNSNANISTDHVDVTVVGATNHLDQKSNFSNHGPGIDVFAPGGSTVSGQPGIFATIRTSDSSYGYMSGTSMACPGAAGLTALLMAANPDVSAQNIETTLYTTCTDFTTAPGGTGNDNYWGWGRINSNAALQGIYNGFFFPAKTWTPFIGSHLLGNAASLATDDGNLMEFGSDTNIQIGPAIGVEFAGTSTNMVTNTVEFQIVASSSHAGTLMKVSLFDFVSNDWVDFEKVVMSTTDTTTTVTPSQGSRYRQAGTGALRAKITWEVFASEIAGQWRGMVDRVAWKTKP